MRVFKNSTNFNLTPFFSGMLALNRTLCYELLIIAYTTSDQFGTGPNSPLEVVYNNGATLFTSMPIVPQSMSICLDTEVPEDDSRAGSYEFLREHYTRDV